MVDGIERADHASHAGDFDSNETYERIVDLADGRPRQHRSRDAGATDDDDLRSGVTFVVTNDTGSPRGWGERVVETARGEAGTDADPVAVAGHTHEVVDTTVEDGSLEVQRRSE